MTRLLRFALIVLGLVVLASGGTPAQNAPAPSQPAYRRSIVHHNPYPYPGYYRNDPDRGFRNPGGVGRYNEYYTPNDPIATERGQDPVRAATFAGGEGPPGRDEQLAAQQIGIAKASALQQHIDSYARPYFGFGYGVGSFGGYN